MADLRGLWILFFMINFTFSKASFATGQSGSLQSVPDLEKAMYFHVDGKACVRLLNTSGEIGCANPNRVKVTAPVVRFNTAGTHLDKSVAILIPLNETAAFFTRVLNEPALTNKVAGLLVEYEKQIPESLSRFSLDKQFPQSEFAPYPEKNYEWNSPGTDLLQQKYNFPVLLLSNESTITLREAARLNEQQNFRYPLNVVEFDHVMQTTKSGTHTSVSCLKEGSCLPLGGYSIWSSLSPINVTSRDPKKPIILALASIDSASFFRDKTIGADSPLSGMIALLAAVDALSHVDDLSIAQKQIVFLFVTGEAWGFLGSRRFLAELIDDTDSVDGLNLKLLDQVVEVGSVGKAIVETVPKFFIHSQQKSNNAKDITKAFQKASASFKSTYVNVGSASASNPGIPPSSLMSFIHQDASIPGIVLEDFNTTFVNAYFHSFLDDHTNINASSITAAASLVARTLYILAHNGAGDKTTLESIKVNETLVKELVGCLLSCDPGLSCALVKELITPTQSCANHYVGVLLGEPSPTPYPENVDDTARFIWNFLANRTSAPRNEYSTCSKECKNSGELCVGLRVDHEGICMVSTTRYVPAYSTRLSFESDTWKVIPVESHDEMGKVDPIWTESFWKILGVRAYKQQSTYSDGLILISGLTVTLASFLAIFLARSFFLKALKND